MAPDAEPPASDAAGGAGLPGDEIECLDAVFRLQEGRTPVSLAALARRLGATRSDAARRVQRLERRGLASADAAGRIGLTPEGARAGIGLVRKHRLLERFLADQLGLPWERVHEEATRLTPVLSDDVAAGLARLLGHPSTCPHGNPIPSAEGVVAAERATPLHRLRSGQGGTIVRIEREEPEMLKYLAALGLLPGMKIEVDEVAPFGGPLLVRVGASRYAIGRQVAARILVAEV
jgi:DtxR family Mn-dependent transcriptional regulator